MGVAGTETAETWLAQARSPAVKTAACCAAESPVIYQFNETLDDGGFGSHSHRLLNQSQALFRQPCGLAALKK